MEQGHAWELGLARKEGHWQEQDLGQEEEKDGERKDERARGREREREKGWIPHRRPALPRELPHPEPQGGRREREAPADGAA